MSNYKPYFRYLRDMNIKMLLVFVAILSINTVLSMIGTIQSAQYHEVINFASQCSVVGGMICVGVGFFYSLSLFASTMSIKADRAGYLKAVFLWGIIFAVGFAVFSSLFDGLCKVILESFTGRTVKIYSDMMWVEMGNLKVTTNIINRMTSYMFIYSLGFLVGAIWYRLKIKTSIIIFVIIPVILTAYGVNFGMRNPEKMSKILGNISDKFFLIINNQSISMGLKLMAILVFSIVGIRLMIKAPIKDYANDLF